MEALEQQWRLAEPEGGYHCRVVAARCCCRTVRASLRATIADGSVLLVVRCGVGHPSAGIDPLAASLPAGRGRVWPLPGAALGQQLLQRGRPAG
jgi:hypothetical protein